MGRRSLGCCEYTNTKGEVAHVLGCCCDCDILDSACDRCLRCQPQRVDFCEQMSNVVADRLRIPWGGGAAAVQLQLDVFYPILIIPTLLVISIVHYYVAWTVSVLTPMCLMYHYRCWRRNPNRTRTRFFFSWGLVSIFTMGYVFFCAAVTYREVYLAEGLFVLGLFVAMLYSLYLTKQDPGSIRQDMAMANNPYSRTIVLSPRGKMPSRSNSLQEQSHYPSQMDLSLLVNERLDNIQNMSNQNHDFPDTASPNLVSYEPPLISSVAPPAVEQAPLPTHLHNSIPIPNQPTALWCDKCSIKIPLRASHCSICNVCYSVRDHHCIWLDQCIGLRNHRAFIMTIILFIIISSYGLHLTLTTICTPIMVLDFFLLPANCRYVYADLLGAIAYVSCCYTVVTTFMVCILFVQQLILISQNITIQEFNSSVKQRSKNNEKSTCLQSFFISDNNYNFGFKNNWATFLRRTRHEPTQQIDEESLASLY